MYIELWYFGSAYLTFRHCQLDYTEPTLYLLCNFDTSEELVSTMSVVAYVPKKDTSKLSFVLTRPYYPKGLRKDAS
jgi:hypothetical protein